MKEMRLFEVGLKSKSDATGYNEKANVAASAAEEAVTKMRQWVVDRTQQWWDDDGRETMIFEAYADDKNASKDLSDAEILATEKYQKRAQKDYENIMQEAKNLHLAKVLDIGTLIV